MRRFVLSIVLMVLAWALLKASLLDTTAPLTPEASVNRSK